MNRKIEEIVKKFENHCTNYVDIFFRNNIPLKKLHNATSTYALNVKEDDVLILVETGLPWGGAGAKEGALLTSEFLYAHNHKENPKHIALNQINSIEFQKALFFGAPSAIYINENKFLEGLSSNNKTFGILTRIIKEILTALNQGQLMDVSNEEYGFSEHNISQNNKTIELYVENEVINDILSFVEDSDKQGIIYQIEEILKAPMSLIPRQTLEIIPKYIEDNERIKGIFGANYIRKPNIIVITNLRILLLFKGPKLIIGLNNIEANEIRFNEITRIQVVKGMIGSKLILTLQNRDISLTSMIYEEAEELHQMLIKSTQNIKDIEMSEPTEQHRIESLKLTNKLIKYLQDRIPNELAQKLIEYINDDNISSEIFKKTYILLPNFIKALISSETYVQFCMKERGVIIQKLKCNNDNEFKEIQISEERKYTILEQIEELYNFRIQGIITEEEYESKKKILLDKIK